MTALWLLLSRNPVARWLAGALTAIAGLWAYGASKRREGAVVARSKARSKAAADYNATRKRIDDAETTPSDPDVLRDWLRERGKQ